jgi:hypothetical protein
MVPADEPESEEEFVMNDADVTQLEDWIDPEHLPPTSVTVFSIIIIHLLGLAPAGYLAAPDNGA